MTDAAGSSVPEAARAAVSADIWRERAFKALATLRTANDNCDRIAAERDEARRHATALRAEVELLHQDLHNADAVAAAVAEERATTGRRIEAKRRELPDPQVNPALYYWRSTYNYAIDDAVRAALASPGEET